VQCYVGSPNEWKLDLPKVSLQTHSLGEFKVIILRGPAPENDYLLYINYHPASKKNYAKEIDNPVLQTESSNKRSQE